MSLPRDPRLFIDDMMSAAEMLEQIIANGEDAFVQNPLTRLASERLIEIIGEAATQLPAEIRQQFTQVPWRDLVDMRNRIIHGYHTLDARRVWAAIVSGIPELARQLQSVLEALDSES